MRDSKSLIYVAKSQVGYHEGRTGVHWNNIQKYAPAIGLANGLAWCDTFVNWCFLMTDIKVPAGVKSAGCLVSVAAYKKAKRWTEYPVIGGQVFYGPGGGQHTEIVTDYNDQWIWTVGGNTNTTGSAEGDGVYAKKRARKVDYVYGYGIPYFTDTIKSADPKWGGKAGGR